MCGRHFVLDLFDIGSRFTESKSLKKWKISENIQFFGPIFYQVQVVIISHKIRILKSKIRHIIINFVQKTKKKKGQNCKNYFFFQAPLVSLPVSGSSERFTVWSKSTKNELRNNF